MSKYGVFSGRYFLVFGLNKGKYGPEKTPYLDSFHAVFTIIREHKYQCLPVSINGTPLGSGTMVHSAICS